MEPIILYEKQVLEDIYIDKKSGKHCIVMLNRFGYRVGYVEYSKKVPLRLVDDSFLSLWLRYENKGTSSTVNTADILSRRRFPNLIDLNVHGGTTFAGNMIVSNDGDTVRVVGFDCAHCMDRPDKGSILKYFGKDSHMYKLLDRLGREQGHLWTLEETKKECEKLAAQVNLLESVYLRHKQVEKKREWKGKGRKTWNKKHGK